MIQYEPLKILFNIGNFNVNSWGVMFIIAFLVSFFLVLRQAKKQNIEEKHIYNIGLLVLIGAIIGARLFHILENPGFYFSRPLEIFALDHGGMTSYGGIFLALLFSWFYTIKQKINFCKILDLFAPYAALALAIGRIGCFLNWCCYGISSSLPWAIAVAGDVPRHPAQLYLALSHLVTFSILIYFRKIREKFKILNKPGSLFLFFLIFYAVFRFAVDFLREYSRYWLGLAFSQWICIVIIIAGLLLINKYNHH